MRTSVDLVWIEGRIERWMRFGRPIEDVHLPHGKRRMAFPPEAVFALVRWASNEFGTIESRIDILQAVGAHEKFSTIPFVSPGADILLRATGWPKVEAVLIAIDQVEGANIPPEEVCPDHWRHVHNRLSARLQPRLYTATRHAAWMKRREVLA
jgi:hypothetical protein